MLHSATRIALVAFGAVTLFAALLFAWRQNVKGGLGGRISRPKIAWLFYSVFVYFVVCPALAFDSAVLPGFRWTVGLFGLSMWLRGLGELFMLYVTKNWRPPLGIAHDVLCLVLIGGTLAVFGAELAAQLRPGFPLWTAGFVGLLLVSLVLEIVYAGLFFQAVRGRTTGDEGTWFADEEAHFVRINRLTAAFNVPLLCYLAAFLAVCLGAWPA